MDWKRIKAEYLAGGTSYRKLAEKYGISRSKLQSRATRESWVDLKGQAQAKTESKIVDLISDQTAKKAVDIIDVADKLLEKIEAIAETVVDPDSIKKLTSAIKDLKDVKGLKSEADTREQEARIRNLEKQAEKDENDSEDITVIFGTEGGQDKWAE